jgi:hypothetical protein
MYPPLSSSSWCMKGIVTQSDCEEVNRFLVERRGNLIHSISHSKERIVRRENLIHPLRHCEEVNRLLVRRRENLINPARHCEERSDVRISSTRSVIARRLTVFWLDDVAISSTRPVIARSVATWQSHLVIFYNNKKMRSSRLRKTKPQDDVGGVR